MVITQSILCTPGFGLKVIHTVDVDNLSSASNVASESTDSSFSDVRVGGQNWSHISPVPTFKSRTFWFASGPTVHG